MSNAETRNTMTEKEIYRIEYCLFLVAFYPNGKISSFFYWCSIASAACDMQGCKNDANSNLEKALS